jgi:hypothetical protein
LSQNEFDMGEMITCDDIDENGKIINTKKFLGEEEGEEVEDLEENEI